MKVIVDTCIWSLALRRSDESKQPHGISYQLYSLIEESRVQMLGPIRQELLSGISSKTQFEKLRTHLNAFPDLPITTEDYEYAAECFNICRSKGVQGSSIDFLICAVAVKHKLSIFTSDNDFNFYARWIPINLLT